MKKENGMKQQSRTEKTTAMKPLKRMPEYHLELFKIESTMSTNEMDSAQYELTAVCSSTETAWTALNNRQKII